MQFIKILIIYILLIIILSLIIIVVIDTIKHIWKFLNILEIKLVNRIINKNSFYLYPYILIIWLYNITLKIAIPFIFIITTIKILLFLLHSLVQ